MKNSILILMLVAVSFALVLMMTNPIDAWIKIGTYYTVRNQATEAQMLYGDSSPFVDGILSVTFPTAFGAVPIVNVVVHNMTTAEYAYLGELTATAMKIYSSVPSSVATPCYTAIGDI